MEGWITLLTGRLRSRPLQCILDPSMASSIRPRRDNKKLEKTMFTRLIIRILVIALTTMMASSVWANDLIVEQAWFQDTTGEMSLAEVQTQNFNSYTGLLTRGYQSTPHWIRLSIDPALAISQADHFLRIQPHYLDYVWLYDPLDSESKVRVSGDMTSLSEAEYQSLNFTFTVPVGDAPRDIYLRLETTSSSLLAVQLLPFEELVRQDRQFEILAALLLSLLLLIVVWSLFQWLVEPSLLVGSFLFKQFVVLTHAAGYLGYWRLWFSDVIPPIWLNEFFNINIFLMTMGAIWFFYQFLLEYQPNRWGMRLFAAAMLFLPLQLILQAIGMGQVALQTVAWLALVMPIIAIYLSTTATVWQSNTKSETPVLSRNQLTFFFALLGTVLWVYVLPVLGLIRVQPLTLYGILVYNLVSSLMMMAALKIRAQHRNRIQVQVQERLLMAQGEVERERAQREEQKRFMDMLTHELKNPLSTIRLVTYGQDNVSQQVSLAIQDMQNIIDRCAQFGQIEADYVIPHADTFSLNELVLDCQSQLGLNQLRLQMEGFEALPALKSDAQLLHVVVQNLLDNAMKYSPPGSPVKLVAKLVAQSGKAGIELAVMNEMGVVGRPDPKHVFDKYYRSLKAQRISGSGLGLPIAKGLLELLGGELRYEHISNPESRAPVKFVLWLPLK